MNASAMSGHGICVLVVDDEEDLRDVISQDLELFGYETKVAANGKEALAVISAGGVDVVVTDLRMPVMSGIDMIEALRQRGDATPVVVLTAYGDKATSLKVMAAGAFAFLAKPYAAEDLHRVVGSVTRRAG